MIWINIFVVGFRWNVQVIMFSFAFIVPESCPLIAQFVSIYYLELYILFCKIYNLSKKNTCYNEFIILWLQISVYWLCWRVASKLNSQPSNLQMMQWNFQLQYSYPLSHSPAGIIFIFLTSSCEKCISGKLLRSMHSLLL